MLPKSLRRIMVISKKETLHFLNDPANLVILIILPLLQIVLFGYAINTNPKHLPIAVIDYNQSQYSRELIRKLETSKYFKVNSFNQSEENVTQMLRKGEILLALHIRSDFTRKLFRAESPDVLLEADYSDFNAVNGPVFIAQSLMEQIYKRQRLGVLNYLGSQIEPINLEVHRLYNPTLETINNITPALIGVILFISLAILTSHTITDERTQGTYSTLLNSPLKNVEIIIGKSLPYVLLGYVQLITILFLGWLLFSLAVFGKLTLIFLTTLPFILAALSYGIFSSMIAKSNIFAEQLVFVIYLPSLLLSGFLFPFQGMPFFARLIGELLPMTHYIRLTRGIFLKEYNWVDAWMHTWPILLFVLLFTTLSAIFFKKTLD